LKELLWTAWRFSRISGLYKVMIKFQEWLELREGSQGLKKRERRAEGLLKRQARLDAVGGNKAAAEALATDAEAARSASVKADVKRHYRVQNRNAAIILGGKKGRELAKQATPEAIQQHGSRSWAVTDKISSAMPKKNK